MTKIKFLVALAIVAITMSFVMLLETTEASASYVVDTPLQDSVECVLSSSTEEIAVADSFAVSSATSQIGAGVPLDIEEATPPTSRPCRPDRVKCWRKYYYSGSGTIVVIKCKTIRGTC